MAGAGKADGRTECDEGQILLKFVLPEPVHDEVDVMLHRRVRPPQPTASARLFKSGTTKGRPQISDRVSPGRRHLSCPGGAGASNAESRRLSPSPRFNQPEFQKNGQELPNTPLPAETGRPRNPSAAAACDTRERRRARWALQCSLRLLALCARLLSPHRPPLIGCANLCHVPLFLREGRFPA